MKGDFTRTTFDPTKHFSGVLMQQGRVQLDADWNEQQAISQYLNETAGKDTIGICGAPGNLAGFEVTVQNQNTGPVFTIGKGHFYVDGILCENDKNLFYDSQPDFPSPPALQEMLDKAGTDTAVAYLDVWQRHITSLEDPFILEKALSGVDTTTRIKTVWQVNFLPVKIPRFDPQAFDNQLKAFQKSLEEYSRTIAQVHPEEAKIVNEISKQFQTSNQLRGAVLSADEGNLLKRNLNRNIGRAYNRLHAIARSIEFPPTFAIRNLEALSREFAKANPVIVCNTPFVEWIRLLSPADVTMNVFVDQQETSPGPCFIPGSAGYSGSENQLYRVEIHQGGELKENASAPPTFKWSRDNGTVTSSLEKISGAQLTVQTLGQDQILGFAPGQWVEILDDSLELSEKPGQLLQISNIDGTNRIITLSQAPAVLSSDSSGVNPALHPKIRRWDQTGNFSTLNGIQMTTGRLNIENNIKVQFSNGTYKTGMYWNIPGRVNGQVEWPPFDMPHTNPVPQPPRGITHHYCQLGIVQRIVQRDPQMGTFTFQDCRRIFAPLAAPAMRVTGVSWQNDEYMLLSEVLGGLQITLDSEPAKNSVTTSSLLVTLDYPVIPQNPFSPVVSTVIDGSINVTGNVITWSPQSTKALTDMLNTALKPDLPNTRNQNLRMRICLKGQFIWMYQGLQQIHLDGRAYGEPFVRIDKTAGTSLIFPSGSGDRSSDFESWFFVGRDPAEYEYGSETVGGDLI